MDEVMNKVITFNISDSCSNCVMSIDLEEVAKSVGKYAYHRDENGKMYRGVILPLNQARKICKMIAEYADPEDFNRVSKIFEVNSKLSKIWEELRCQSTK